jgi:hypothetical protein
MLIRIAKEPLGSAFPKDMGKLTKVQLTTGIIPKTAPGKQAAANTVKIGTRLFLNKPYMSFGYGCSMPQDEMIGWPWEDWVCKEDVDS